MRTDSTEENIQLLRTYLERNGRPLSFYTDKASLFYTTPKVSRSQKDLTGIQTFTFAGEADEDAHCAIRILVTIRSRPRASGCLRAIV